MKTKIIAIAVCFLLLLLIIPITTAQSFKQPKEPIIIEDNTCIQSKDQLTIAHTVPLLRGFIFIENHNVQLLIIKTIFEILLTGNATFDEIQEFINSTNITIENLYLLPNIKTTKKTDGQITCMPGLLRALYSEIGFIAFGSYLRIDKDSDCSYGWHLEIDDETTNRANMQIFGFFGHVKDYYEMYIPPDDFYCFELNGFAVMVFEGC